MEKFYFIPTSSLNFNNILSSESISPPSFYGIRGYGFKRFEKVLSNSFSNSFLAYSSIPRVPLLNSEKEEYLIYLAVPNGYLKSCKVVDKGHFQIIQIDKPLYINPLECFFLVRSEEERKKLIVGSNKSLEVKHSTLYSEMIFSLDEYHLDSISWDDSILHGISDLKDINLDALKRDQKLNKLKGLIYGYTAGFLMNQPSEFVEGKRYLQKFINVFSGLMNDLSAMAGGKSKAFQTSKKLEGQISELKDLQEKISILFGGNETLELDQAIEKDFSIDKETIKLFEKTKYKNSRESILSIIYRFLKEKNPSFQSIDELLGKLTYQVNQFIRYNNSQSYARLENEFRIISDLLNSKISTYKSEQKSTETLKEFPINIDVDFGVKVKDETLNREGNLIFEVVLNELLGWLQVSTGDEIAQIRVEIIENVGKKIKEEFGNGSNPEIEYLRRLFQSLKTVGVGFRPDESENITLQSLACFLNRYTELEKLQDFMEKNGVRKFNYAYTYWGTAYGYANLSKLLISPISQNAELLNLINSFLESAFGILPNQKDLAFEFLSKFKGEKPLVVDLSPKILWKVKTKEIPSYQSKSESQQNIVSPKKDFFSILEASKDFKGKYEWIDLIINESKSAEKLAKEIRNSKGSWEDFAIGIFKESLLKKTAKVKSFGEKKVATATELYSQFLKNE